MDREWRDMDHGQLKLVYLAITVYVQHKHCEPKGLFLHCATLHYDLWDPMVLFQEAQESFTGVEAVISLSIHISVRIAGTLYELIDLHVPTLYQWLLFKMIVKDCETS